MDNPLLKTLECRDNLTAEERRLVTEITRRERAISAGSDFVREGESPTESCLMLSGLSARYNVLGDGKRQITAIHIAGDFVDLHCLVLHPMDHSVASLTDCRIASVPHALLREISETAPHLTRMLWMLTVIDAAIFRRSLIAAATLPARSQISHFICEMHTRLAIVGLTDGYEFELPISQSELADAMGLSIVQVNRSLQILRHDALIRWQGSRVEIIDWARLSAEAEFDPTYLNLERKSR